MKPHSIRDYLTFLNKEKNGILVFIFLLIIIKIIPHVYIKHFRKSDFKKEVTPIEIPSIASPVKEKYLEKPASEVPNKLNMAELKSFDPNTVSRTELLKFGLKETTVNAWLKARENGYKFYSAQSVKSMYKLENSEFLVLEKYIDIPKPKKEYSSLTPPLNDSKKKNEAYTKKRSTKKEALFYFDPNDVSKEELMSLGLKDFVADNWIHWREKGKIFYTAEEVIDVNALLDRDFKRILPFIRIKPISKKENLPKTKEYVFKQIPEEKKEPVLETFNPNEVDVDKLISFGLPREIANRWIKLISSGGRFYKPEDISKIYDLSEEDYSRLIPYVEIRKTESFDTTKEDLPEKSLNTEEPVVKVETIDLNYSDEEDWKALEIFKDIEVIQIIKLREALGGFHSLNQLQKLHFIDADIVARIMEQVTLRKYRVRTIKINSVELNRLQLHPYIRYDEAKVLLKKRKKKGPFQKDQDIIDLDLFDESTFRNLAPYLEYNEVRRED